MTLPSIDATIAHALMAAIGNIGRFACADKLAAYFGLVPSVHQSAEHCHLGPITKQGNTNVRWLLIQAAQIAARHPGPLGHQFEKLARRKRSLDAALTSEHLPPTTPAPNGEQRMLTDWHLTDFAQGRQRETRIPRHNTHAAPRQTASAGG